MSALSQVKKISPKYAVSAEEFIRSGAIMNLREKQRLLKIDGLVKSRKTDFLPQHIGVI